MCVKVCRSSGQTEFDLIALGFCNLAGELAFPRMMDSSEEEDDLGCIICLINPFKSGLCHWYQCTEGHLLCQQCHQQVSEGVFVSLSCPHNLVRAKLAVRARFAVPCV